MSSTSEVDKQKKNSKSDSEEEEDPHAPPRPDKDMGDFEEEEDGTTETTGVATNDNDNDENEEQNNDDNQEESATPTVVHTEVVPTKKSPIVYSIEEMLEFRISMKKSSPLLSTDFQQFMKGIAFTIEGNVTTFNHSANNNNTGAAAHNTSSGAANNNNNNVNGADFFGRSTLTGNSSATGSGVATPYSPGLNSGPTGDKFPGSKGNKGGLPLPGPDGKNNNNNNNSAGPGAGGIDFNRNALFADVKVAQNAIKERTLLHKVRGIFAKVSHDNFQGVKDELCALPIRQSDDKEVREIIHWIYDKAVQPEDEIFVELYASLVKELTNDIQSKDAKKGSALRKALVEKCQQSFDKRSDVAKSTADEISNAQNAETTVESRDSAATVALKNAIANDEDPEYVKQRERSRLRANIKFLAQLFRVQMVTSKVVNYVLYSLLYGASTPNGGQRHKPEEYEIEMFIDLIKSTQQHLPPDIRDTYLPKYLETVKEYSKNKKISTRVGFLLEDLVEIAENGWMTREQRRSMGLLVASTNAPPAPFTMPNPTGSYVPPGQRNNNSSLPTNNNNNNNNNNYGNSMNNNNNNNNNSSNNNINSASTGDIPTPPYSPIVNSGPPAYPPTTARGGRGAGRGSGSPAVAIPLSQQAQMNAQLQQQQQQQLQQQQQPALPPNADKETFITVMNKFKENEFGKQEIVAHMTALPHHLKSEHVWHWVSKSFKLVRKQDDRKLLSQVIQIMIDGKLCRNTLGFDLMSQLAPQVVLEFEDNPRIFVCWSDFMQPKLPTVIPLASNCILLRQMVRDPDVAFSTIEKMLTDVVQYAQPNIKEFINPPAASAVASATANNNSYSVDTALHRFRMLPIILNCNREDIEEFEGGYGGEQGSSMSERGASSAIGGNNGDDDAAAVAVAPMPQRKDLLGYLLTHPTHPRTETTIATEIELDVFGILTNFEATSQVNLAAILKKAKNHAQRSDPAFYAGFFCALFCYLRLALVTGEKTDFDKIRELMTLLKVPGDNTQLFMRECYMTWCELGAVPHAAFSTMIEVFCPGQNQTEMKAFNDWKSKHQWVIGSITGRAVPARPRSSNSY